MNTQGHERRGMQRLGVRKTFIAVAIIAGAILFATATTPTDSVAQQPTVFVHGLTGDATSWADAAAWLASELPIDPVLPTLGWQSTFQTQAEALHSALGGNSNVVAVGGSNGAIVLRRYLQHYEGDSKIDRIMAVGSLHEGAMLAQRVNDMTIHQYAADLIVAITDPITWSDINDPDFNLPWYVSGAINEIHDFAYFLVSLAIGIGFDTGAPVLDQMPPGSSFISNLNSTNGLAVEAANTTTRVGIGTSISPFGGVFRSFTSDVSALIMTRNAVADFASTMSHYYTWEVPEPEGAALWKDLSDALLDMDFFWAWLIGAYGISGLEHHDGVVSLDTQQYPGADIQENFEYPSYDIAHKEQKDDLNVRIFMRDSFLNEFQVDTVPVFDVSIDGPAQIQTDGTYNWTAQVQDGTAPFNYSWEMRIEHQNPTCNYQTPWWPVGSDQDEFSHLVSTFDFDFRIRVSVEDDENETRTSSQKVHVIGTSPECPEFVSPQDSLQIDHYSRR
jgi:pimeloyl-ACP methyl ester carboxylesterase